MLLYLIDVYVERRQIMLYWAVVFLIVAIVAGVLGFGGISAGAASIAQISFYISPGSLPCIAHYGLYDARPSSPADMSRRDGIAVRTR